MKEDILLMVAKAYHFHTTLLLTHSNWNKRLNLLENHGFCQFYSEMDQYSISQGISKTRFTLIFPSWRVRKKRILLFKKWLPVERWRYDEFSFTKHSGFKILTRSVWCKVDFVFKTLCSLGYIRTIPFKIKHPVHNIRMYVMN